MIFRKMYDVRFLSILNFEFSELIAEISISVE